MVSSSNQSRTASGSAPAGRCAASAGPMPAGAAAIAVSSTNSPSAAARAPCASAATIAASGVAPRSDAASAGFSRAPATSLSAAMAEPATSPDPACGASTPRRCWLSDIPLPSPAMMRPRCRYDPGSGS